MFENGFCQGTLTNLFDPKFNNKFCPYAFPLRCCRQDQRSCITKPTTKRSDDLSLAPTVNKIMAAMKQIVNGEYFLKNSRALSVSKVLISPSLYDLGGHILVIPVLVCLLFLLCGFEM